MIKVIKNEIVNKIQFNAKQVCTVRLKTTGTG